MKTIQSHTGAKYAVLGTMGETTVGVRVTSFPEGGIAQVKVRIWRPEDGNFYVWPYFRDVLFPTTPEPSIFELVCTNRSYSRLYISFSASVRGTYRQTMVSLIPKVLEILGAPFFTPEITETDVEDFVGQLLQLQAD